MSTIVFMSIVFWLIIIIGVTLLVIYLLKQFNQKQTEQEDDSLDILKQRYAKGEIDKKEYQEKKKELEKK